MASLKRETRSTPVMSSQTATAPARSSAHPALFIAIVGAGFLALFAVCIMTQVQTNEAFITHAGQVEVYKPNWSIVMQIPNLVLGNLSPDEAMATIFGWGIELMYLGFIVGYELLQDSAQRSGQLMAGLFRTLSWVIVIFNGWTDFNYGSLGGGFWGHVGFALVISFIVGYFGTIGMYLLECAWRRA